MLSIGYTVSIRNMYQNGAGTPIAAYHIERDDSETGIIFAIARTMPMYHNETWHDYCYMQYLCLYHIETYYNEMYQKEIIMLLKHEMRLLAIRFFNLSFKKQLVILLSLYVMFIFCSLLVTIAQFMYILASF